jgi:hypothetical protein
VDIAERRPTAISASNNCTPRKGIGGRSEAVSAGKDISLGQGLTSGAGYLGDSPFRKNLTTTYEVPKLDFKHMLIKEGPWHALRKAVW